MSRTTIENAALALVVAGTAYEFNSVINCTITDPQENTLSGSPQGKGDGVIFRTGTTTPVTSDFVVREVPRDLFNVMKQAYENQTRVDILLYDQITGDNYEMNQSIIRANPSNLTVAEGEEQLNVNLNTSCAAHRLKHTPALQVSEQ